MIQAKRKVKNKAQQQTTTNKSDSQCYKDWIS